MLAVLSRPAPSARGPVSGVGWTEAGAEAGGPSNGRMVMRGACGAAFQAFLYGGYFKDSAGDPEGSDRGVVFSDLWVLDLKTWQWDKVSRARQSAIPRPAPVPRAWAPLRLPGLSTRFCPLMWAPPGYRPWLLGE